MSTPPITIMNDQKHDDDVITQISGGEQSVGTSSNTPSIIQYVNQISLRVELEDIRRAIYNCMIMRNPRVQDNEKDKFRVMNALLTPEISYLRGRSHRDPQKKPFVEFAEMYDLMVAGHAIDSSFDVTIINKLSDSFEDGKRDNKMELNVLFVGDERCGKSTIQNLLLGDYYCKAQSGPKAATTGIKLRPYLKYKDHQINLLDSEGASMINMKLLKKIYWDLVRHVNIHLFVIVWDYQKSVDEAMCSTLKFFGNYLIPLGSHLMIIVNKCDSRKTSDAILDDLKAPLILRNIEFDFTKVNLVLINENFVGFDRDWISGILAETCFQNKGKEIDQSCCYMVPIGDTKCHIL
jgi:GTPase SAR1 family protein